MRKDSREFFSLIHIFIPVYNEEASLKNLIEGLYNQFNKNKKDFTLLIVDDGSSDNTAEVLNEFKDRRNFSILTHNTNRGLGETERDGFEFIALKAKPEDIIIRVEGDNTHDPKYIFNIIQNLIRDMMWSIHQDFNLEEDKGV